MEENKTNKNFIPILPTDSLEGIVDLKEETGGSLPCFAELKKIANENDAVLLAFVAPYVGERVSPIEERSAAIDTFEEIGMGAAISQILKEHSDNKELFLLLDSPGGRVDSSYKVAIALRKNFENIVSFIPRIAASGGTLVAIISNKIVMGDMAHLTPIDIQVPYRGERVSVNTIEQAITRLEKYFKKMLPVEAPYPYRSMTEKLDPILREDWSSYTEDIIDYSEEILKLAGYEEEKIFNIILKLIFHKHSHSFVINKERAEDYGLNISSDPKYLKILDEMSKWLAHYFPKTGKTHFTRYIFPDKNKSNE